MNVIFTILFAFAIGFFVKQRGLAIVTYLALDAFLFVFQTAGLILDFLANKNRPAFGPHPTGELPITYSDSQYFGYGVVNLVVLIVGIGLVTLGTKVAARREAKHGAVVLD